MYSFGQIIPFLQQGKKVKRVGWFNNSAMTLSGNKLKRDGLPVDNCDFSYWLSSEEKDWVVIVEPKKMAKYVVKVYYGVDHIWQGMGHIWQEADYEIGHQPVESFLIPGSEHEVDA